MPGERLVVRGRVQGVGFRYATLRVARALGIRGTVRNREDGTVEIVAFAPEADLERFRAGLRRGMPGRVDEVEVLPDPRTANPPSGFRIVP